MGGFNESICIIMLSGRVDFVPDPIYKIADDSASAG
jgi:hypothetical protein